MCWRLAWHREVARQAVALCSEATVYVCVLPGKDQGFHTQDWPGHAATRLVICWCVTLLAFMLFILAQHRSLHWNSKIAQQFLLFNISW